MPSVESSCQVICLRESHRRKCTGMHCPMQDGRNICWTLWSCPLQPVLHHYAAGNEGTFTCLRSFVSLSLPLSSWRRGIAVQTRMNQTGTRSDYKPSTRCRETTKNCTAVWALGSSTFQRKSCGISLSADSYRSVNVEERTKHAHTL